jgi:hypothetical protein
MGWILVALRSYPHHENPPCSPEFIMRGHTGGRSHGHNSPALHYETMRAETNAGLYIVQSTFAANHSSFR